MKTKRVTIRRTKRIRRMPGTAEALPSPPTDVAARIDRAIAAIDEALAA